MNILLCGTQQLFTVIGVFVFLAVTLCQVADLATNSTSEVLLPEGNSFSKACFSGQSWCFTSATFKQTGGCTSLLYPKLENYLMVWENETAWIFNITEAHDSVHTGSYSCGDEELFVDVVEYIPLNSGDSFERTCNTRTEAWCFKKPGELCDALLISDPSLNLVLIMEGTLKTLKITDAQSFNSGRYRCDEHDILIAVEERKHVATTIESDAKTEMYNDVQVTSTGPTEYHESKGNTFWQPYLCMCFFAACMVWNRVVM